MSDDFHDSSIIPDPRITSSIDERSTTIIRPLTSIEDYEACAALEREVWGLENRNSTPVSLLLVITHIGGLVAGAFTPTGTMLGFVLSIVGTMKGSVIHWSHLLAVRDVARNLGIGRLLKEFQLAELARRGIAQVYWSFDPLMAKNAHLNINRLGARVVDYVPNMYGVTISPLHYGLPTDRLVVACATTQAPPPNRPTPALAAVEAHGPILTPFPQPHDRTLADGPSRPPVVWIEIPTDIQDVLAQAPDRATVWRAATRRYFTWALQHGYEVTGVHGVPSALSPSPTPSRAFYVLEATPGRGA
jgi:predicted GNAT superfamily acetyltransferase